MAPGPGREPGGYLTLVRLIEQHRGAFAYDWRTRFGQPIDVVEDDDNNAMDICEAWLLFTQLLADPSSHVHAAAAGWAYPLSREGFALADLIDLMVAVHTEPRHQPPGYPRPGDQHDEATSEPGDPAQRRLGRTDRCQADVHAALRARGH